MSVLEFARGRTCKLRRRNMTKEEWKHLQNSERDQGLVKHR